MTFGLLLVTVLTVATPCPSRGSGEPTRVQIEGCGFASCAGTGDLRVCSCAEGADSEVMQFGVRRGTEWLSRIPLEVPSPLVGGPESFRVFRVDLDGDGNDEIVGTILGGSSVGLAVEYWSVVIWDGSRLSDAPVIFSAEEFGDGSFATWPGEQGCRVLATNWGSGSDRKRGEGTYFYGRWSRYARGRLTPVSGEGILARRLLNSFQEERGSRAPLRWLRGEKAERRGDPLAPGPERRGRAGKVVSATPKGDHLDLAIAFGDETTQFCYGNCPRGEHEIEWLGDLDAGVAFPRGYWAADVLGWRFASRVMFVEKGATKYEPSVLWVTTKPRE